MVYAYVRVCAHIHAYVFVCVRMCAYVCNGCVCAHMCTHMCTHVCMCVCASMYMGMSACGHEWACGCVCGHVCEHLEYPSSYDLQQCASFIQATSEQCASIIQATSEVGGDEHHREIVSCRAVRACVCARGLAAMWNSGSSGGPCSFHFPFFSAGFPLSLVR